MNESANKALVRRWFDEVWNKGKEATIDELFASNGVTYGLGETDEDVHGPAQLKPFVHNMRGSFPDIHITIEDIVAEGDKVMVRIVVQGTHSGGNLGIPATGQRIRVAGIVLVRVSNGQLVEGWNSWDQLGMLRQIGALPRAEKQDRFLTAKS
jgi:steroid delta-isomerase-like uncharacterized protein